MEYKIGVYWSKYNTDFSAAIIAKVKNGAVEIIDSKTSIDSEEIKDFIKGYEPEYFTVKYKLQKLKKQRAVKLKRLVKEGRVLFFNKTHKHLLD